MGFEVRMVRRWSLGSLNTARLSGTLFSSQAASLGAAGTVLGHEPLKLLLRASQAWGIPNGAELFPIGLANGLIGSVVDGVLGEVELAALPAGAGQHGLAGGLEAGMIV